MHNYSRNCVWLLIGYFLWWVTSYNLVCRLVCGQYMPPHLPNRPSLIHIELPWYSPIDGVNVSTKNISSGCYGYYCVWLLIMQLFSLVSHKLQPGLPVGYMPPHLPNRPILHQMSLTNSYWITLVFPYRKWMYVQILIRIFQVVVTVVSAFHCLHESWVRPGNECSVRIHVHVHGWIFRVKIVETKWKQVAIA